ncbi:LCP family protein [Clostridium merdae]|uniref:LCP family protein n=1 Tax=Clostridium merdae TaxID=1958780 RepID=UPI001FA8AD22|nr:LCP family protein [Clostridium merdae]
MSRRRDDVVNKNKPMKGKKPSSGKGKKTFILNVAILVVSLVLITVGGTLVYADHLLGRIQFQQDPVESSTPQKNSTVTSFENIGNSQYVVNGLYHDDKILNVLLLGVDDYEANDRGRSDSMLLVSLDRRHEKLKMTSFMRDLYVSIPGYHANKLTVAYSLGGPTLTVQTIENSFGVDIDRYVLIGNDSFNKIIDRLGGVTLEITSAEAKLINTYSGEPSSKRLTSGVQHMTGRQAHYYSRIRAIGDDYERTLRQRKVLQSIVDKFKSADLGEINGILYDVLPLVKTNMTKNEILSLAANSLTYLNYPTSQNRIPVDGAFTNQNVPGVGSSLIADFKKNHKKLVEFIYEEKQEADSSDKESSFESR